MRLAVIARGGPRRRFEPHRRKRRLLPRRDFRDLEALDRFFIQAMKIQFGAQAQEGAAEADGGAVHEDEFARHFQRPLRLQRAHHREHLAPAIFAGLDAIGDGAHAVVDQRAVDEARPDVQRRDRFARQILEAPDFIGVNDARLVARFQPLIKFDDAADETGGKDADAAIVEEIDALDVAGPLPSPELTTE